MATDGPTEPGYYWTMGHVTEPPPRLTVVQCIGPTTTPQCFEAGVEDAASPDRFRGPWVRILPPGAAMPPAEFAARMRAIFPHAGTEADQGDEDSHTEGDRLMGEVLRSLGYGDGVDVFEAAAKWYA